MKAEKAELRKAALLPFREERRANFVANLRVRRAALALVVENFVIERQEVVADSESEREEEIMDSFCT
ncbi:Uncharacterized protein TCM_024020 [Theobroma cacao]|uniref:Uncharacterized protein n=1 Tax=Theobroma cacao TaxID=3641 RepID=A0A061EWL8_THECC|nr:Uncharacterized protein TCM_024020 [Theobroma cacao]